ncbi:MAG: hypothetical protein QGF67_14055 [Lentisphaeria bacterium]|jgi:hypothetical protein|nr:hypothetical protein [Lentisphaeria bacterium]MDP7742562.1 hypothetical protein [Lentisphaeria bacterium]
MELIKSNPGSPFSFAVIHHVKLLDTVLAAIPPGGREPFAAGCGVGLQKRQLMEAGFMCEVPV